jgi:hypothetical protein
MSANNVYVDSMEVMTSHAFRRRSDEGASGHAEERACLRSFVCRYGKTMVNVPCMTSIRRGRPDSVTCDEIPSL